nr:unnamed protein product [Spirometra erinaceieuropaei]
MGLTVLPLAVVTEAPRLRHWHLLDYVLVRKRDQRGVLVTRAIPEPPLPSPSSSSSSFAVPTAVGVAPATHVDTAHNPDISLNTISTTVNTSGENQDYICPHCDRTFTSHIGLVDPLTIHRTDTGEPEPGAPTDTRAPAPLSTLPLHVHASHGPVRPHAHPRERN